jgi:hypothetical protein
VESEVGFRFLNLVIILVYVYLLEIEFNVCD